MFTAIVIFALTLYASIYGRETITNENIKALKRTTYSDTNSKVITNKDVERLKQKAKTINFPSSSLKKKKESFDKKNISTDSNAKQAQSPSPDSTPQTDASSMVEPEPLVRINGDDRSVNIVIKGYSRTNDSKLDKDAEGEIDYTLPRTLRIMEKLLPYEEWEGEYSEYFEVHYDDPSTNLDNPSLITIRCLKAPSLGTLLNMYTLGSVYDEGDDGGMYGHLSSHFVIDINGMIIQTMPLNLKTRGCEGLEHKAFTIELIGVSSQQLENNEIQKESLTDLLFELCKKFEISPDKIYSQIEAAEGNKTAQEYMDLNDSEYPDAYSPKKNAFGPSKIYTQKLREEIKEKMN